jgi:hypothetical protein
MGRIPTGKITVQLRMAQSTRDELERCAIADHKSLSECAETAMLRYFKMRKSKEDNAQ